MKVSESKRTQLAEKPFAVLFDADNTLFDYDAPHANASAAVLKQVNRELGIEAKSFTYALEHARKTLKDRLGPVASSHNRLLYYQGALEKLGLKSRVAAALSLERRYWQTFMAHAELFPGARDFLDNVRAAGVVTCLVTDLTAQIQFRKIIFFGLEQSFDFVVTSEEAGRDKPNREPFKLTREKLSLPDDVSIWMIGENPRTDIVGAKRHLGALTFQKMHPGVPVGLGENAADVVFREFSELQSLIVNW